jgi:hypothetical protein
MAARATFKNVTNRSWLKWGEILLPRLAAQVHSEQRANQGLFSILHKQVSDWFIDGVMDSEEHKALSASIPVASNNSSLASLAKSQCPEVFEDLVHHPSPTIHAAAIQVMPLEEVMLFEDSLPTVPSLLDHISSLNPNFVPSSISSPSNVSVPPPYESKPVSQSADETMEPTAGDPTNNKVTNDDEKSDAETIQKVPKKVLFRDIPVLPVKKCKCIISLPSASKNNSNSTDVPIVKSKPVPKSSSH